MKVKIEKTVKLHINDARFVFVPLAYVFQRKQTEVLSFGIYGWPQTYA